MTIALFAFFLALGPAALLAHTLSPSATVLNQLVSIGGWGIAVAMTSLHTNGPLLRRVTALAAAAVIYIGAALVGWQARGVPASMAWSAVATVVAALVVLAFGARCADEPGERLLHGFAGGMVLVGCFNVAISLIQVFAPDLADGEWVAHSGLVGRAVGNLRQPNHLSSFGLWSAVAVVPLLVSGKMFRHLAALLFALFVFSIELSASRTGMVGVVVIALWGLVDRRLGRYARVMLVAAPVVYAIGWVGMSVWAEHGHTFGAAARLGESDISGSRYGIWKNALTLIGRFPLWGVGFGEFNFAWTLTPFPGRPTAFFDHTHNIVLQLLVELGLPLGGLMVLLMLLSLWQAFARAWAVDGPRGAGFRTAFVMVLLVAIHSQLEYPLWYAYFLLPAAWAWGYCLGGGQAPERAAASSNGTVSSVPQPDVIATQRILSAVTGCLMVAAACWAFLQYQTVSYIFEPDPTDKHSLTERIEAGRRSLFYAYHADYANVTVAEHPSTVWDSFRSAPHYLLDTRLMIAWANAFAERGDLDHARFIADRLREFHKEDADDYFAPCEKEPAPKPLPYQCSPPSRAIDWHEFRAAGLWK